MPVALLGSKYFKILADFKYSHKVNVSIMNYFKSDSKLIRSRRFEKCLSDLLVT